MAPTVTLESPQDTHSVTVSYPDMPYLGIWHMPKMDAPYVCIEPWRSLPAAADQLTVFEEKPDLVHLEAGQTHTNRWIISCT